MNRSFLIALLFTGAGMGLVGCPTAPQTEAKKDALHSEVEATLNAAKATDPSLDDFLDKAHAYVVFPNVGKGGFIVGGAYGRGEVYEQGRMIGHADITQGSVGLQAGGQTFSQIIALENKAALDRFTSNRLELAANASAVALNTGVAATARYTDGVAVFTRSKGGLMAEASVGGQQFSFTPAAERRE
jgi:lipid-binding SYLF domain-containing protein